MLTNLCHTSTQQAHCSQDDHGKTSGCQHDIRNVPVKLPTMVFSVDDMDEDNATCTKGCAYTILDMCIHSCDKNIGARHSVDRLGCMTQISCIDNVLSTWCAPTSPWLMWGDRIQTLAHEQGDGPVACNRLGNCQSVWLGQPKPR